MVKGFWVSFASGILLVGIAIATVAMFGVNGDIKDISFLGGSRYFDEFPEFYTGEAAYFGEDDEFRFDLAEEGAAEFGLFERLTIESKGIATYIRPSDGDRIRVSVSDSAKDLELEASTENGRLKLEFGKELKLISFSNKSAVLIELPREVYESIEIKQGAGAVFVYGVETKELDCRTGAGALYMKNIKALDASFELGAGDMEIEFAEDHTANELKVKVGAGDLDLINAAAEKYDISVAAGDADISGLTGHGKFKLTSGGAELQFAGQSAEERSFDVSSGEVKIYIPDDTKGVLNAKASSGRIKVNCCGRSDSGRKLEDVSFNGGEKSDGEYNAEVSSGTCGFLSNEKYHLPTILKDFPEELTAD